MKCRDRMMTGLLSAGIALSIGCSKQQDREAEYGRSEAAGWTDYDEAADVRAQEEQAGAMAQPEPRTEEVTIRTINVQVEESLAQRCGVQLPSAFFEFDSSELRARAPGILDQFANCLNSDALKDRRISLVGYADPRGPEQYNRELATDRAQSVADYLVSRGVQRDRIEVISRGENVASERPSDYVFERRVDIQLLPE